MARWVTRFNVIGDSGDPYVVSIADDESWGCSCPSWKFARKDRLTGRKPDCKHVLRTRDGLQVEIVRRRQPAVMPSRIPVVFPQPALAPAARFAGLDVAATELALLAEEGLRFRYLEFEIETRRAA